MASCSAASYRQLDISYLDSEASMSGGVRAVTPVVVIVRQVCQLNVVIVNFVALPLAGSEGGHGLLGDVHQGRGHCHLGE